MLDWLWLFSQEQKESFVLFSATLFCGIVDLVWFQRDIHDHAYCCVKGIERWIAKDMYAQHIVEYLWLQAEGALIKKYVIGGLLVSGEPVGDDR